MKKKAAAILITAMALNLVACSSSNTSNTTTAGQDTAAAENADTTEAAEEGDSEATEGEGLKIAFFMYENSNTFTTYIRLGLENYGAEHNVTVESFDGRSDQATQTDGITAALATGQYDLVVVNPVDSGAGATINSLCEQNGVPVIYADRAPDLIGGVLDEYEDAYYVGLDWSEPGAVQAEMMYEDWKNNQEAIDTNGDGVLQYVILQGNVAQQNAIYRTNAIHDLMDQWNEDGTMPNGQLDIQDGNWTSEQGRNVMDTWNVRFGDQIEAVLCNNDTMALGVVEAVKSSGKDILVVGVDGIGEAYDSIRRGELDATIDSFPFYKAQIAGEVMLRRLGGQEIPRVLWTPQALIDSENVDKPAEKIIGWTDPVYAK